jgi:hypothetical protein
MGCTTNIAAEIRPICIRNFNLIFKNNNIKAKRLHISGTIQVYLLQLVIIVNNKRGAIIAFP